MPSLSSNPVRPERAKRVEGRVALLAVGLALLAIGCGAHNPNFCEGSACDEVDASPDSRPVSCNANGPDTSCPAATPVCESGECTGLCTADTDCTGRPAAEAVCHTTSGACVQCDETDTQATPGQPEDECPAADVAVCDGDTHTCRACESHSECFSKVCDAGRCAPAAEVIYMSANGTDGGGNNCDNAAPGQGCLTLDFAVGKVTAARKYIVMEPSASPYFARGNNDRVDINGVAVHIIGYGAEIRRNGDGHIIEVHGASNVVIEGLKIASATGTGLGSGILMTAGQLNLFKVKLQDNAYRGISVTGGTSLLITRSIVSGNDGGGIFVDAVPFAIVNNFIVNNGDNASTFAGLSLASSGNTSLLEFNTIVDNNAQGGVADVACTNSMVVARNNIINGDATEPRTSGNCGHRNTLYGPDGTITGTMNVLVADRNTYRFVGGGDYHLDMAADPPSVAKGAADSSNLTGEGLFDYDTQPRTAGAVTVDVGADEIP